MSALEALGGVCIAAFWVVFVIGLVLIAGEDDTPPITFENEETWL